MVLHLGRADCCQHSDLPHSPLAHLAARLGRLRSRNTGTTLPLNPPARRPSGSGFCRVAGESRDYPCIFVAAIYLASINLRPYILEVSTSVSPSEVIIANTISIVITAIELVVVVAAVMHFLAGDTKTQRGSLYVLIAAALLDPILTGWVFVLNFSEPTFANVGGFLGLQILVRWGYAGVALLITWALTFLFTTWRQAKVSSHAPSGEVNG
jgi:hypothetical protein